ncbi:hypothetical protein MPTK1_6g08330 [Marchantia polymorpha subsp. ruderalis]|uniref:Uncharacterized protein n=2 Tax=Marchantia polymorpha TaxID=3197 RepID=A0AAF6BPU9_MARPO|nr:hypothetical protein MARPO_0060s0088 [Marchantia polymorpha]BBN14033.1 hypothetical protein Mp_6g08330 [Marchantia polymorpha subsp. ruderalis]|eukprot:PTQ37012.1 hypothetical protein MARPO_0060s0088 [Marchantia polymorpha]
MAQLCIGWSFSRGQELPVSYPSYTPYLRNRNSMIVIFRHEVSEFFNASTSSACPITSLQKLRIVCHSDRITHLQQHRVTTAASTAETPQRRMSVEPYFLFDISSLRMKLTRLLEREHATVLRAWRK